jgi:hypothetical protein
MATPINAHVLQPVEKSQQYHYDYAIHVFYGIREYTFVLKLIARVVM